METSLLNTKTNSIANVYSKLCDKSFYYEVNNRKYVIVSGLAIPYRYCLVFCAALASSDIHNDIRNTIHAYEKNLFTEDDYAELRNTKPFSEHTRTSEIIYKVKTALNEAVGYEISGIFEFMNEIETQRKKYEANKF